jgi:hypothetical protein
MLPSKVSRGKIVHPGAAGSPHVHQTVFEGFSKVRPGSACSCWMVRSVRCSATPGRKSKPQRYGKRHNTARLPYSVEASCRRALPEVLTRAKPFSKGFSKGATWFGEFVLDGSQRQLLRDGQVVQLSRKAFGLLSLLAHRASAGMSKEEIVQVVRPGIHVWDASLTNLVAELRVTTADDARATARGRTRT